MITIVTKESAQQCWLVSWRMTLDQEELGVRLCPKSLKLEELLRRLEGLWQLRILSTLFSKEATKSPADQDEGGGSRREMRKR